MKRIILSSFFCATLLMVLCLGVVNAEETILGSGTCGENLTWTLSSTGELRISGTGEMWDYPYYKNENALVSYLRLQVGYIVIEDGVTSIGDSAFSFCSRFQSVTIPSSITSIGSRAFASCDTLLSISIPNSVTYLGIDVFSNCNTLRSVTIPNSVASIERGLFYSCIFLESVTIPDSVISIGDYAFSGCARLTSISIPNSVNYLGKDVFSGCVSLPSMVIPNGVTSIGQGSFYNCHSLFSVTIPNSITSVGALAFYECVSLNKVYYIGTEEDWGKLYIEPFGNERLLGANRYYSYRTLTTGFVQNGTVVLSNTLALLDSTVTVTATPAIGYKLVSIQVDGLDIGGNTFVVSGNHVVTALFELKSLTLSVETIENGGVTLSSYQPLWGSTITVAAIPNTGYELVSILVDGVGIEGNTFVVTDNHQITATFKPKTMTLSVGTTLNGEILLSNQLPAWGSTVTVTTIPNTGYQLVNIQVDGVDIAGNTFVVTDHHQITATFELRTMTLSVGLVNNGIVSLNNSTPLWGSTVTVTTLPDPGYELVSIQVDGVDIEGDTFVASDNHIVTATFEQYGVLLASGSCGTAIKWGLLASGQLIIQGNGPMADYSVTNTAPWQPFWTEIKSVDIVSGVTSIGNFAFDSCRNLTSITIPNSVTSIGSFAFIYCSNLTGVAIPESVTSIQENTFYGCSNLTSVTIPNSITSIGDFAFYSCSRLTNIVIPESVTTIGRDAFAFCSRLISVLIPEGISAIRENTFYNCTNLVSVTLPSSITSIGDYAFHDCSSLTNIKIPSRVAYIGNYAFKGCINLTNVTIPEGIISIKDYTFAYCTNLLSITIPNSVTTIGDYAFSDCSSLLSMTIPNNVASIWEGAFSNCTGLETISLPVSLTSVDNKVFYNCNHLSDIFYSGTATQWEGIVIGIDNESLLTATKYYGAPREEYRILSIGLVQNGELFLTNQYYLLNSMVTVIATPNTGYNLVSVQVDGVDIVGNTFVVSDNHVVTATFELKKFTASVGTVENGKVSLSDVAPTWGSTVTVTATPNTGYNLVSIQVDGVDIVGNTFVVSDNHVVTATFELKKFTASVGTVENGKVSLSDVAPSWGSTVTVTATPNIGYELLVIQVDGVDVVGNTFVVSNNHTVTALFRLRTLTLSVPPIANGKVSLSSQQCLYGSAVTVTVTPDIGYELLSILVDGVEIEGNIFTASEHHVVTATFTQFGVLLASGVCGTDVEWGLLEAGQLIIRGTGPMYDHFVSSTAPWYSFWTEIKSVEIWNGVSSIGNYAFDNCRNLTSITIPTSVKSIGSYAFVGCISLKSVEIPEGITAIKERAFYACSSLMSVVIPQSVFTIEDFAFYGCSKLPSIIIPEDVTSIGTDAFAFCSSLTSIAIPEGVTWIMDNTFYGCSNLTSITISSSVASIGDYAFNNCSSLTNVLIPSKVSYLGRFAFNGCSSLKSVTIPNRVVTIRESAFNGCGSLTSMVIPDSVSAIGNNAFLNCDNLTTVSFLGNAPSLGTQVFSIKPAGGFLIYYSNDKTGWTSPLWNGYFSAAIGSVLNDYSSLDDNSTNSQNIKFTLNDQSNTAFVGDNSTNSNNSGFHGSQLGKVIIPETVTKSGKTYKVIGIGQYAFANNDFLTSIELGLNVKSVDTTAFLNCNSFDSVLVLPGNTQYKSIDGILFDAVGYYLYIYPNAKSDSTYTVPETVKTIGTRAFYGNRNLTKIVVPNSITSIGFSAFEDCMNLKELTLPFIGRSNASSDSFAYVFGSNSSYLNYSKVPASLETVTIMGGTLRAGAFENMPLIKSISLPALATSIPASSFNGCSGLKSIIFAETRAISEIGQVVLPEQITSIGDYAFNGCSSLESVVIPEGVTTIGYQAFSGCTNLKGFNVHENNPNYHSDMWGTLFTKDLSSLITYPSNRIWPYYNVPNETTTLLTGAFNACSNLVNLYIPATVTNLQSSSIANCPGVTICVYLNSPADTYTGNNNLTAWYMDNYTLQGIEIYSLPEQNVYPLGQEDFSGLYLVADYGGKQLQLDDYELNYDVNLLGTQTVTVEHSAGTASFEIVLFDAASEQVLDFGAVVAPEGTIALVAVYDTFGKMICIESAIISNSQGKAVISNNDYNKMSKAKLFVLDGLNLAPQREEYRIQK